MSFLKNLNGVNQWGHYETNDQQYFLIREAYEHADHVNQIQFNFHNKIFHLFSQQGEPKQGLDDLYRKRVEQIRNKYDHVVLCYSGGADSHNILKYFELTNTPLDEIVTIEDSSLRGRDSVISGEVFKVALPETQKFLEKFPSTRHRLLDAKEYQDKIFFEGGFDFDPVYALSYQFKPISLLFQGWWAYFIDDYKRLHDQGKRVGIIWAIDKPRVFCDATGYHFRFSDFHSMLGHKHMTVKNTFWDDEPFYWTPELPMLPIKQAYAVARYLESTDQQGFNPQHGLDQPSNCVTRKSGRSISYEFINPVIYPYWDPTTFTYGKERTSYLVSERDDSLITANNPEFKRYASGVRAIFDKFASKIEVATVKDFNPNSTSTEVAGIRCMYSPKYYLKT